MSWNILKLKHWLPSVAFVMFRKIYWKNFWNSELHIQKKELAEKAAASLIDSERAVLIENICDSYPFGSLLEVGCAYGQNFHILSKIFPDLIMHGIDKDPERILGGQKYLEDKGYRTATLQKLEAIHLSKFADKSFDLVVTSASLLYIPDVEITEVLLNILRIAKKKVLLLEQQSNDSNALGRFQKTPEELPYWERNYLQLIKQLSPESKVEVFEIKNRLWKTEKWQSQGLLMVIELSS